MNVPKLRFINTIRTEIRLNSSRGGLVVEDDEGQLFVFKPHLVTSERWSAPNELLVTLLGRKIAGPYLEPCLLRLDKDVIELSGIRKRLNFLEANLKAGIGFGLEYLTNYRDGDLSTKEQHQITNPQASIALLLMDAWVHNTDRHNRGNLIFNATKPPKPTFRRQMDFTLYAIDQGQAFDNTSWEDLPTDPSKQKVQVEPRLDIIEDLARNHQAALENFLKPIEAITIDDLHEILAQIPPEWKVSQQQKKVVQEHLLARKMLIRPVFEQFFKL